MFNIILGIIFGILLGAVIHKSIKEYREMWGPKENDKDDDII